jgi:hypothetical protein
MRGLVTGLLVIASSCAAKPGTQPQSVVVQSQQVAQLPAEPSAQAGQSYDKARYDGKSAIESWIEASKGKILKVPFSEAERRLSLGGVEWSKAYTNAPNSEMRIYHFHGFYLILHLTKLMPDNPPMWTSEDLQKRGEWYVHYFYPALHIDGLDDPEKRMSNYWAALSESFRRRDEESKREQKLNKQRVVRRRARSSH